MSTSPSAPALPPPLALFRLTTGYYVSQALFAVARLGVADHMADAPRTPEALATATHTRPDALARVLRLLVAAGVFTEDGEGRFGLAAMGQCLRADVAGSMRPSVLLFGGITQRAWSDLMHSLQTGQPAFEHAFGASSFEWLAAHPEESANFDAAMGGFTRSIAVAVAEAHDFSGYTRIVDVGGSDGSLLAGVLERHRGPKGVVFDLPDVAARARTAIAARGLADRCEAIGGDFFETVPEGADVYLLKHVVHDWNDDRATAILRNVAAAMRPDARVFIVESTYPETVEPSVAALGATGNDVNMLVCTGGRQRTAAEFAALFEAAGLRPGPIVATAAGVSLVEGRRG